MLSVKLQEHWSLTSGKEAKTDFQDGCDLGFPIGTILAIFFYLQDTRCFIASFKSIGLSFQEKAINFRDGGHFGLPIGTVLAVFALQDTPMLPTKFQVSWLFSSGGEAKNIFSRWRPCLISDRTILPILIYKSPRCFLPTFKSAGLSVKE